MEARLNEEGVWELPPLENILAKGGHIWMQNGFSEKKRAQRREQATGEYELYQRVVEQWRQGISYHFIGKEVGKADTVIRAWIERHQLPNILAGIVYKKRQGKKMNIPDVPNNDLLRVIGLCLATTRHHDMYKQRWTYEKNDPKHPALDYARDVLTAAFGEGSFHEHVKRTVKKPEIFYQIIFQSVAFFEYYNEVTGENTRVPLTQMPTLEARLAFVEGFCQGSVTVENEHRRGRYETPAPTGLVIIKKTTPEGVSILEQVALLLYERGCYPHVGVHNNMSVLQITDPDDARWLLEHGCVPASCTAAAEMIASSATGRRIRGQHVYLQAYEETVALPEGLTPDVIAKKKEIAARYNVPMNLIGEWHRGDSIPRIVHRRRLLESMRKRHDWEPESPHQQATDDEPAAPATLEKAPHHQYKTPRYTTEDKKLYSFALERSRNGGELSHLLRLPEKALHEHLDRIAPVTMTANGTTYQLSWQALRDYCRRERFQPYGASGEEWREHLRTIRDCLPQHLRPEKTTYQRDGFTFTMEPTEDKVVVTGIR